MTTDTNLNVFAGGYLNGNMFFGKYDTAGNQIWLNQPSTGFSGVGPSLVADNLGGVYFGGTFHGSATFGAITVNSDNLHRPSPLRRLAATVFRNRARDGRKGRG